MIYKNHEIRQTETVHANTGKRLFSISGRFAKDAARRPFLTSIKTAREWIDEQIAAAEMAARYNESAA